MINNVVLVGRLTKDPDLRFTASGTAVGTFTLATNRNFTNQNGDREADFINCQIWRKPAETLANYARKGTLIGITGRIQTRNYENQQGQRVYVTEVVVENFQLLEPKDVNSQRQSNTAGVQNYHAPAMPNEANNQAGMDPFAGSGSPVDIPESDLPF